MKVSEFVGTIVASTPGAIIRRRESAHLHFGRLPSDVKPVENISAHARRESVLIGLLKAIPMRAPVAVNIDFTTSGAGA